MAGGAVKKASARARSAQLWVAGIVVAVNLIFIAVRYGVRGVPVATLREWACLAFVIATELVAGYLYVAACRDESPSQSALLDILALALMSHLAASCYRRMWWGAAIIPLYIVYSVYTGMSSFSSMTARNQKRAVLNAAATVSEQQQAAAAAGKGSARARK